MDRALRYTSLVLTIFIGYYIAQLTVKPVVEYIQVPEPVVQFDSTGWVRKAMLIEQSQIIDSVKQINEKLYKQIQKGKEQILQLSQAEAMLRLERDSLKFVTMDIGIDTTYTTSITYTDSLFEVHSLHQITGKSLNYSQNLVQLRPIVITTTTTLRDNKVYFYVESPDFKELNIETYTTIKKPKNNRLLWLGSGLGVGIIGWELIR
jgi:hypothetical protein